MTTLQGIEVNQPVIFKLAKSFSAVIRTVLSKYVEENVFLITKKSDINHFRNSSWLAYEKRK